MELTAFRFCQLRWIANNIGDNSIVLTVWDVNGNVSTCLATVTAEDTIAPTAVCQDITVQLDANGNATIAAGDISTTDLSTTVEFSPW